jgi:hypothetical protein
MSVERDKRLRTLGVPLIVLCLFSFWFPASAGAGWHLVATIVFPNLRPPPGGDSQVVTYVSHNKIKYETRAWAQVADFTAQRLLMINHLERMYWEGSIDEYITTMARRAQEVRMRRNEVIQRLPPHQRKAVERRAGPFDTLAPIIGITVTPVPEKKTVAGHKARKYIVLRNDEPYEETWVAGDINLGTDVDRQKLREFIAKLQVSRTTPPGSVLAELTELLDRGYPVETVNLISNITKEVIQVERKSISDEEFAVPKGYTQKALTEMMFPTGRGQTPRF